MPVYNCMLWLQAVAFGYVPHGSRCHATCWRGGSATTAYDSPKHTAQYRYGTAALRTSRVGRDFYRQRESIDSTSKVRASLVQGCVYKRRYVHPMTYDLWPMTLYGLLLALACNTFLGDERPRVSVAVCAQMKRGTQRSGCG